MSAKSTDAAAVLGTAWREVQGPVGLPLRVFVLKAGGLSVVIPSASILSGPCAFALWVAGHAISRGRPIPLAARLGWAVQRALGVTQEDHVAAIGAAARVIGARVRVDRQRRTKAATARAAALNQPLKAPELSATIAYNLDQAEGSRASALVGLLRGDRDLVTEALADVRKHEGRAQRAHDVRVDADWVDAALAETQAQFALKGASLKSISIPEGATLSVHDGLKVAYEAGSITDLQEKAGRVYRYLFEAAPERVRSQMDVQIGGGGGDPVGAGLHRAYAGMRLRVVDAAVLKGGERDVVVLRWVAGLGGTIRGLGASGSVRAANLLALKRALNVTATVIWNMRGLRIRDN